uniref:Uncharacterized protein n=1 Tax=viral metagenome TaxID=1070528 RepID=A0A6H2A1E0_9ZZZZ
MGYWLRKRLHTESAVDANTTYRYKLPTTGLYSAFSVRCQAQRYANRASTTTNQLLHDAISKVELLSEGTKVLKSLRARELKALNLFDFRRVGDWQHGENEDDYNIDTLYLLAGRGLQDKEYMFDMARLRDPELALTNALTETTAEYWKVDTLEYQIYGWRWMGDPVPSPKGYLRADERAYYTTSAADAEKIVEITTGKRIRRLLLMGHTVGTTTYGHIKKIELEVDEGAYSPVIIDSPVEFSWQNVLDYGLDVKVVKCVYLKAVDEAEYCDLLMAYPQGVMVIPHVATADASARVWDFGNGLADIRCDVAYTHELVAHGAGYLNSLVIGFDKEKDLSDMLNTREMGKLKMILTETAASKVVSVVVEEEILY